MSRNLFHLWCIFVVCNCHTHIGYGARTEPRRSTNLSKDRRFQSSDAGYFNSEPLDETSVEKWPSKAEGKRDHSVVRVSRGTKRDDGQAICGKKSSRGVEWSCKKIASCQFAEKLLSMKQRTVCGGEGSSQKICCPDIDPVVKVAQEKCEEYASVSRSTRKKREVSIVHVINSPKNKTTVVGEFPHMALIGFKNANDPTSSEVKWNCGGSLISHEYILTAAHCNDTTFFTDFTPTWVVLGNTTKPSSNDSEFAEGKDNMYRISKSIRHPGYNLSKLDNDTALFKLNRSVKFNRQIRPACLALPPNVTYNAGLAIVTGWGQTKANGMQSEKLLETSISVLNNSICEKAFKNETSLSKGFDAISMICAGNVTPSDGGTCGGDSGGPLQYRIDDSSEYSGMWFQKGITSFGKLNCEDPEPKIFTRVSHFLPWIQSIVWPTKDPI